MIRFLSLAGGSTRRTHRMCIVEPDQSGTIGCIQGKGITDSVRTHRGRRHLSRLEFHRVSPGLDCKLLPIKIEQCVERGVRADDAFNITV